MLGELIPLALVVALSPLSIIPAVWLVLHTEHPRPTGLAFMVGWLVGLAALTAVFVQVPHLVNAAAGLIIGTAAVGFGIWVAVIFYTVLAGSTVVAPIVAYTVAVSASIRSSNG